MSNGKNSRPEWVKKLSWSKWFVPYERPPGVKNKSGGNYKNGRFSKAVRDAANMKGVYLIASVKNKKILYVGASLTNMYDTITRRFQTWNDRNYNRITYIPGDSDIRVAYINMSSNTDSQVLNMEASLIEEHQPSGNRAHTEGNQNNFMYNEAVANRAGKAERPEVSELTRKINPWDLPEQHPDYSPF